MGSAAGKGTEVQKAGRVVRLEGGRRNDRDKQRTWLHLLAASCIVYDLGQYIPSLSFPSSRMEMAMVPCKGEVIHSHSLSPGLIKRGSECPSLLTAQPVTHSHVEEARDK